MAVGGTGSQGQGSKHPVKIFANIFISFIGAGVLGLPFAFKEAGILEGIFVMSVVGFISVKAMLLLIDCKYKLISEYRLPRRQKAKVEFSPKKSKEVEDDECNEDGLLSLKHAKQEIVNLITEEEIRLEEDPGHDLSYGDVGYYAIGRYGRLLVDLAIVVSQAGFCCAYLIFITENLSDYINSMKLMHWLLILLPPLCILTLLRHLGSLALTSLMAQCSNLLAFGVVFWFDFEHFEHVQIHPKKVSLIGLPFFICIAIYCYEGAGMILSLESSLAKEVRHKFKTFFIFTMFIVTFLYISFGSAGYLSFGPETNAIITLNLPKGESLDSAMMVKSLLCLALFLTYPVMMFPVVKILESYLMGTPEKQMWRGNALRISLVIVTGLVVIVIPNFANLMALIGATCCTMLAFVLPGLFHMTIFKGSLTVYQVIIDWSLMFMGIVGAIIGTIDAFKRMGAEHEPSTHITLQGNITTTIGTIISTTFQNITQS